MTPTYWVEMALLVSGDRTAVEQMVSVLGQRHDGHISYTFSHSDGRLSLAMSTASNEPIEMVAARAVGAVRAICHELGFRTPGWPEPLAIDDVRIKTLTPDEAAIG